MIRATRVTVDRSARCWAADRRAWPPSPRHWRHRCHADMMGNAFLSALTNAGVSVHASRQARWRWGSRSVRCWSQPGGSFDSVVVREWPTATACPTDAAGVFTIVAIATYCPAVTGAAAVEPAPGLVRWPARAGPAPRGAVSSRRMPPGTDEARRHDGGDTAIATVPAARAARGRRPRARVRAGPEPQWSGPGRAARPSRSHAADGIARRRAGRRYRPASRPGSWHPKSGAN